MNAIFRVVRAGDPARYFQLEPPAPAQGHRLLRQHRLRPRRRRGRASTTASTSTGSRSTTATTASGPSASTQVLRDYWALLDFGWRYAATGSSDSHRIQYHWAGYPRTMVTVDPHAHRRRDAAPRRPARRRREHQEGARHRDERARSSSFELGRRAPRRRGRHDRRPVARPPARARGAVDRRDPRRDRRRAGSVVQTFDVPSRPTQIGPEPGTLEEAAGADGPLRPRHRGRRSGRTTAGSRSSRAASGAWTTCCRSCPCRPRVHEPGLRRAPPRRRRRRFPSRRVRCRRAAPRAAEPRPRASSSRSLPCGSDASPTGGGLARTRVNAAFGRYRLLERLGQGGMAEVFKAKSYGVEGFEKILVIKRILPELARSQDFVEMFIHEAKLAVRLSHANIVQVFDLGKAPAADAADGAERRRLLHGDGVRARARPRELPRALAPAAAGRCPSSSASTSPPRSPRASTTRTAAATSRCARSASCTATCRRRTSSVVRGRGQGHRLRHRQGARRARPGRSGGHPRAQAPGQVRLHEPRAGARRERRRAERPLLARHHPLRVRRRA